jgi:uncharacterized protein (TIGR03437 family)
MQRFTRSGSAVLCPKVLFGLILFSAPLAGQQFPVCVPNAGTSNLRSEGLAESAPDITLQCSQAKPNVVGSAIVSIFPSVNITNHLSTGNTPDIIVSVTAGGFQQPAPASIQLIGTNQLNISGIQYTPGPDGTVTIRISNLRLNANAAANGTSPLLSARILATGLNLTSNQIQFGALNGLLSSSSSQTIYTNGSPSPVPTTINLQSLFNAGTPFATNRVTEGFANAFIPKDLTSDTGTRIMIQYSGLPPATTLYVPDLIAGSSAIQPTSAGALGLSQLPGIYASSANGSLLLARVANANPDGSGGTPVFRPPPSGTSQMTLTGATLVLTSGGAGSVVYEVVDANPTVQESAQIPTFIALAANTAPGTASASVTFAPLSTVGIATMTDPVPRFAAVTPPLDCTVEGDCSAAYYPHLKLNTSSVNLQAPSNGTPVVGFVPFVNSGGGTMQWTASVSYQTGSGWISLNPTSGSNASTVNVHANPVGLAPGTYNATITIDAGPMAGSQAVPVVFTVGQAVPLITQVSSAANGSITTLVPESFASIYGTGLSGNNVTVSFDGVQANLVYSSATQINLLVPGALTGKSTSQMLVSVDGRNSTPVAVTLASAAPAVFTNGILNQDNTVNSTSNPAAHASTLQIFLTGLPPVAGAMVNIGNSSLQSVFSGQAPGVPGLEQVNVMLPANLTGTAQLTVCTSGPSPVCTPAYSVTIQ